jgi:DNA-directed RNA polymerase subunit A'
MSQLATRYIKTTRHIYFGPLTRDEIERLSAVEILKRSDGKKKDEDHISTVYDPRLGTIDPHMKCATCGHSMQDCPGHFGHIVLARAMYNPIYIKYTEKLLNVVCHKCHRLIGDVAVGKETMSSRFEAIVKELKKHKACAHCGTARPKIKLVDMLPVIDKQKYLSASSARAIFSRIPHEDLIKLGFIKSRVGTRPETVDPHYVMDPRKKSVFDVLPDAFIFEVLPVPPPHCRPPVCINGEKTDDDITRAYNAIIGDNNSLWFCTGDHEQIAKRTGAKRKTSLTEAELCKRIYEHIINIFDSSKNKKNSASDRQMQGFVQRDSKKEGHLNKHVGSKRSDFTARGVIVPGGEEVELGEFGVPEIFCSKLTIPVHIQEYNLNQYRSYVEPGSGKKASIIIRRGRKLVVSVLTENFTKPFELQGVYGLQIGDILERPLENGDDIIVNRQPTIRLESMQTMRVKKVSGHAFMLPVEETTGFNADFDGKRENHCSDSHQQGA